MANIEGFLQGVTAQCTQCSALSIQVRKLLGIGVYQGDANLRIGCPQSKRSAAPGSDQQQALARVSGEHLELDPRVFADYRKLQCPASAKQQISLCRNFKRPFIDC
jgi:protein gp37